jgi:hypothetical protein
VDNDRRVAQACPAAARRRSTFNTCAAVLSRLMRTTQPGGAVAVTYARLVPADDRVENRQCRRPVETGFLARVATAPAHRRSSKVAARR